MVGVGRDRRRRGGAHDFRVIELLLPGIAASHKNPADGVARPPPEAALSRIVEARILVKDGGKDCSYHEVLDRAVGRLGAVALGIAHPSLPIRGVAVPRL